MKRYYKSLLSLFMSAVIVFSLFAPTVTVSAEESIVYSEINLVPDGEASETGYLNEIWVDENGDEVIFDSVSDTKPVPNNGALIPSEYSSVELGYVTDIRDQKSTNSCWAFSAVAAAETSLLKQGLATNSDSISDLSEAHLVWFTHKSLTTDVNDPTFGDGTNVGTPYAEGGYWLRSTYSLARGAGFALEKDYPFYGNNSSMMGNYDESERYTSNVTIDGAYIIPEEQTDEIKKAVMDNGSVMVAAAIYTDYLNKGADGHAYYQNVIGITNHQMIIVGWDDNFSVSNFAADRRPSSPGAWLVKNSYGADFADDGYFWISYEEPSLDQFVAQKVSVANEEESIYQYDGYGYRTGVGGRLGGVPVTTGSEANVFTAEKNEMLNAVSFYTMQDSVEYEISVYKNVTSGKDTPIADGIKSTVVTTGYAKYKGYHKVPLSANIALDKGENFAVVVSMNYTGGNDKPLYIPYEGRTGSSDGVYICYYSSESGQSYYQIGSDDWVEASADEAINNVCVKAFTVPDNSLEIRTAEEFNAFAEEVADGKSYEGKNINLMNDIDFDGGEIIPVGTEINPFAGYFRGNGYVLRNGVINSDSDMVGVFSVISEGSEISKLGVENISVTGVYGVGAICGINEGVIRHCYSIGSVSGEESVGGLVGINCGTVSSSYSICDVGGDYCIGSLIGENDGGKDINCYVSSSSSFNAIGNDYSSVTAIPDKCFTNGLAAFYLDEGKTTARAEVWTKRDGVTTFLKSEDEIIYQVELYDKQNMSSLYLYVKSSENLKELAESERPGEIVTIYADPQHRVPYTAAPKSNIILYVEWSRAHICSSELEFVEGTEADCYNDGVLAHYKCSCGKLYGDENAENEIQSVVIPAFSHPEESVDKTDRVEASCTEDGNVEYYTCTLCGDSFSDSECTMLIESTVIPALDHIYSGWITETEADCENDGLEVNPCSGCDGRLEKIIPATGHEYGDWHTVKDEDCENDGIKERACSICGDIESGVIAASGHSYSDWFTETQADCENDGLRVKTCSLCGDRIEQSIPASGHNYESFVTVPTETTQGFTTYLCSVCGDNYTSDYIDPVTTISFCGTVKSYLSETDEITVELIKYGEEEVYRSVMITGNNASFNIERVLSGVYTVRILKNNHVTREYENIVIKTDGEYEFKVCPIGDVNGDGKVTVADYTKVLKHAKQTDLLKDYEFACADVTADGKVTVADYTKVLKHAKQTDLLW